MTTTKIKSTGGDAKITLHYGGSQFTRDDEVNIKASDNHASWYFNGPALRDALIEAFPPPEAEKPKADWEKELLSGVKAKVKQCGRAVAEPERLAPGTVWRSSGSTYVALPDNKVYVVKSWRPSYVGTVIPWSDRRENAGEVVFDPRDANALPSPLGVRVGDTVRRVQKGDRTTVTTEFQVNHIDRQIGYAYPKYGLGHPVGELEVLGREVPDRLPAGTIVRYDEGTLRLRTEDGWINLTHGSSHTGNGVETDVREGHFGAEVVYLPES